MKISQSSFGARLDNAKKVWIHTSTFSDFNPPPEQSVVVFGTFLTRVEKHNVDAAADMVGYSNANEARRQAFKEGENSLYNMAFQILAAVRSLYGLKSRQASDVKIIVNRFSPGGKKTITPTAKDGAPIVPLPKGISKRETGFGNMLKTFADLVTTVKNYGPTYTPANPALAIDALEKRLAELSEINRMVTLTYSALTQTRFERTALYKKLIDTVQRIKNAVKSQYGGKSKEYILVKAIKA